MGERKPIELEAGWSYMEVSKWLLGAKKYCVSSECTNHSFVVLQSGIRKLIRLLEKEPEEQFKPDLYMMLYT